MAIKNEDVLGYLMVLNVPKVLEQLTTEERLIGRANILGSLMGLAQALEEDINHRVLFLLIQNREYLNSHKNLPVGHPELVAASEETAFSLLDYLRGNDVKQDFLKQLDESFAKILEKMKWD